jgi:hypothetical protein
MFLPGLPVLTFLFHCFYELAEKLDFYWKLTEQGLGVK